MKILVTGITGFVGRHLAKFWEDKPNTQLYGTGRSPQRVEYLPAFVQYFPLKITDPKAVNNLIVELQPDVVIHSAAMSKPNDCETDKKACLDINVNATQYVVDACKK